MKLKLAGIALKRLQNATETQVAHRRVELSRSYLISFQYFKLLYTIITFPYKLYLHCVTQLSVIIKMFTARKELGRPVVRVVSCGVFPPAFNLGGLGSQEGVWSVERERERLSFESGFQSSRVF